MEGKKRKTEGSERQAAKQKISLIQMSIELFPVSPFLRFSAFCFPQLFSHLTPHTRHLVPHTFYSYLSASTGFSFAAREAGYIPATKLTTMENPIAPATNHHGTAQIVSDGSPCRRK